jgi:hypothetical protein
MIELMGTWLMAYDPGFNVLRYLTVRTIGGTLTALLLSIFLGPIIIKLLTSMQFSQSIRHDGPESHLAKSGTPTMGGLIIILGIFLGTFLWSDLKNIYVFGGITHPRSRWEPWRKERWMLVSVDANGKQTGLRYTYKIKNIPKNILTIEIWNSAKTLNVNPAWKKKNISVTYVILTKQPGNSESSKFWRITPVTSSGLRIGVNNAYKLENEVTDYVFTDTNVDCKNWTEGKIDKTAISSPGINTITKCGDKCNKNAQNAAQIFYLILFQ